MSILVCGSVAYDSLFVFYDKFKNHLLANQLDNINVSFFAPDMRREFGGCAGNIAYNLQMLDLSPYIVASVGNDFAPYAKHLDAEGISRALILQDDDLFTAQAMMTTDQDNNQIATFHPGAIQLAHHNVIPADNDGTPWQMALIGPDSREAILTHAKRLAELKVPFIFDPGQAMPILQKEDLLLLLDKASWLVCNEYEYELLQHKTGLTADLLMDYVDAFIVTLAEKGSMVYTRDNIYQATITEQVEVDPTGCGDAYRAGLIYGILHQLGWQKTADFANVCAGIKLASLGGQNHRFNVTEIEQKLTENKANAI